MAFYIISPYNDSHFLIMIVKNVWCWGPGWSSGQVTAIRTRALVHGHRRYFLLLRICWTKMTICSTWHSGAALWLLQLGKAQQRHNNHAFNRLCRSKELLNHPSYIWGTPILRGTCRKPRKPGLGRKICRFLRLRNWLGVGWAGFFPVSLLMVLLVTVFLLFILKLSNIDII